MVITDEAIDNNKAWSGWTGIYALYQLVNL